MHMTYIELYIEYTSFQLYNDFDRYIIFFISEAQI